MLARKTVTLTPQPKAAGSVTLVWDDALSYIEISNSDAQIALAVSHHALEELARAIKMVARDPNVRTGERVDLTFIGTQVSYHPNYDEESPTITLPVLREGDVITVTGLDATLRSAVTVAIPGSIAQDVADTIELWHDVP